MRFREANKVSTATNRISKSNQVTNYWEMLIGPVSYRSPQRECLGNFFPCPESFRHARTGRRSVDSHRVPGIKGPLTLLPPDHWYLPTVAFSYGEAFHTEDPRIGPGTTQPALLSPSRAYHLVLSKVVKQTQLYVTLRRVSNSQVASACE